MGLEARPDARQVVWVALDDRMGVSDGDPRDREASDLLRLRDLDGAQILLDQLTRQDSRPHLAGTDADGDALAARSRRQPAGGDAGAVAGHLRLGAVRVPDPHVGPVLAVFDHLDDPVRVADGRA